ncbi:MAG: fimbrial protein [Pseudomonadota bacterium]
MNRLATLLLVLLLLPLGAQATCIYSSGGNTNVVFSLPSTISVPANTPNGATLATTGQVSPDNPPTIDCGYYRSNGRFVTYPEYVDYGVVNALGGTLADNYTFATGVPGVGFRITHPTSYLTAYPLNTTYLSSATFSVTSGLELVKTGAITSGSQLVGGKLADWRWGSLIPETFRLANTVTFITPSCDVSTDPTNVVLPPVSTGAFTGVGATSGTTPFHISLSCSGGMAVTQITMHTASPDSHTGVIQPSGNGYAVGIGVRVLDNGMNPVTFETPLAISPGATTSIPFYAQYFQTAAAISGGNVKATVTFDIYYQ